MTSWILKFEISNTFILKKYRVIDTDGNRFAI